MAEHTSHTPWQLFWHTQSLSALLPSCAPYQSTPYIDSVILNVGVRHFLLVSGSVDNADELLHHVDLVLLSMAALCIALGVVLGEVRVDPYLNLARTVESDLLLVDLEVPRVLVELREALQGLNQDEEGVVERDFLDLGQPEGDVLEIDIGCVFPRAYFPPANFLEEDGVDDGGLVFAPIPPVERLQVEIVLVLAQPGKLVFVHHRPRPAVAQSPPTSEIPLLLSHPFPLRFPPVLALDFGRLFGPHANFINHKK